MILIVGGEGAGKKEYALSLGFEEKDFLEAHCGMALQSSQVAGKLVYHAERLGSPDPAVSTQMAELLSHCPVVIANEVGSGIIPATKDERIAREVAGRMTVLLAKQAETVVRVVCGIPAVIKGELR